MILTLAFCLAGHLGPVPAAALTGPAKGHVEGEDRLSLEELLRKYRDKRETLFQQLRIDVNSTVAEMESAYELNRRSKLPELRTKLLRLGAEAVPLFLEKLDPGAEALDPIVGRSRQMGIVLSQMSTRTISIELISILKGGSVEGQSNALVALSGSDDPERVGPVLREAFANASKRKRGELITAIANLGGEENFAFVGQILENQDSEIVKAALTALTDSKCVGAAPRILALVTNSAAAAAHISEILAYYRACPQVVNEAHVGEWIRLAQALSSNAKVAADVLQLVGQHQSAWNKKIKDDLKDLSESPSRTLSEAALVCLARSGDNRAKKKLLDTYDEMVEKNERIATNWQRRAEIKYQIEDYKGALKDFQQARKTFEEYLRTDPDIYVGMSRCYIKLGKLKEGSEILQSAGLSLAQLHLLAKDPDFAEMAADSRLNKVFRLGEE